MVKTHPKSMIVQFHHNSTYSKELLIEIENLRKENDTLADTVNILSPLMMKCHNLKKLLEEVLEYGEKGLCIDEKIADKIAEAIDE